MVSLVYNTCPWRLKPTNSFSRTTDCCSLFWKESKIAATENLVGVKFPIDTKPVKTKLFANFFADPDLLKKLFCEQPLKSSCQCSASTSSTCYLHINGCSNNDNGDNEDKDDNDDNDGNDVNIDNNDNNGESVSQCHSQSRYDGSSSSSSNSKRNNYNNSYNSRSVSQSMLNRSAIWRTDSNLLFTTAYTKNLRGCNPGHLFLNEFHSQ